MSERRVAHLVVSGRVQGVGFRYYVRTEARRLGVDGWVRNRDDGTVELIASGPAADVERLVAAVRRGPPGARVDEVRELPSADAEPLPSPFTIER